MVLERFEDSPHHLAKTIRFPDNGKNDSPQENG
jgi:hypothetical protein